jgi:hypothetical protein
MMRILANSSLRKPVFISARLENRRVISQKKLFALVLWAINRFASETVKNGCIFCIPGAICGSVLLAEDDMC